jgi:hypothetical protein
VLGAVLMIALLFYPGVRDPEREPLEAASSARAGSTA